MADVAMERVVDSVYPHYQHVPLRVSAHADRSLLVHHRAHGGEREGPRQSSQGLTAPAVEDADAAVVARRQRVGAEAREPEASDLCVMADEVERRRLVGLQVPHVHGALEPCAEEEACLRDGAGEEG
eukprot:755259-Hanusia_phi.AAC.10